MKGPFDHFISVDNVSSTFSGHRELDVKLRGSSSRRRRLSEEAVIDSVGTVGRVDQRERLNNQRRHF
jgi:hypothetical protein